ncbi:ARC35 (YNR035C) [Zygosaccharomyces parabailii]|nr:ARC35 (YNR035C) [Zygosaccharomyces parabailii]CDH17210.1 probable Actin-related protein 2/3 complex subunit 2 [Zygosaccharomyces bailii ISA1307]
MLHLQPHNLLIQKTLGEAVDALSNGTPLTLDRIISDFDYTTFHVTNSPQDKSILLLSIRTKAWQSVQQCKGSTGLVPYLQTKYADIGGVAVLQQSVTGYDFTMQVQLSQLSADSITRLSLLKIMVLSYPFQLAFDEFAQLSTLPVSEEGTAPVSNTLHTVQYRDEENLFIKPASDRITVIFETVFQDETDKVFGKVFLQEFVDARKRNRSIQSAPQVLFSHEPPLELQNQIAHRPEASRRFVTFVLFPRHFQTPDLQFHSVAQLTLFRNYFHYHIKCSKAYMHSRMRYRVDSFIKVLNRAKVDEEEDSKDSNTQQPTRRTITGRKMVY